MNAQPHPTNPEEILMPPAVCIHIKDARDYAQVEYIGRAMKDTTGQYRALLGMSQKPFIPGTPWENRFPIERDTWKDRIQSLRLFRSRIWESSIRSRIHELRGKALACWCAPKPCHGDTWAALANMIRFYGAPCPKCSKPITSELRPAPGNMDELLETWRCKHCQTWGKAERGPLFVYPPDPQPDLFESE